MAESACKICKRGNNINPNNNPYLALHHYETAHKNICAFCNNKAFTDKNTRSEHMRNVHLKYPCDICWLVFTKQKQLNTHMQNPKTHVYNCNRCAKEFTSNADWWVHMFDKHEDECLICDNIFDNTFSEKFHRDTHLMQEHNMLPCNDCWAVFYSGTALDYHYEDEHRPAYDKTVVNNDSSKEENSSTTISEIQCIFCCDSFPTLQQWQIHYNTEHLISCHVCDKKFKTETERIKHFDSIHYIQCIECNEFFTSETIMLLHYNAKHRIECSVCDKVFNSDICMKEHFNVAHKLSCDLCEKICVTLGELQLHCNVVHHIVGGIQQPYRIKEHFCSACNADFPTEKDLVAHYENLHIDE